MSVECFFKVLWCSWNILST